MWTVTVAAEWQTGAHADNQLIKMFFAGFVVPRLETGVRSER